MGAGVGHQVRVGCAARLQIRPVHRGEPASAQHTRQETADSYLAGQTEELHRALAQVGEDQAARKTRKAIERKLATFEERRLADHRVDPG